MDIEKMQKINRLSKELVEKGIFSDLQEATKQAEVMINKNDNSISHVFGTDRGQPVQSAQITKPSQMNQNFQPQQASNPQEEEDIKQMLRKLSHQASEQAKIISDLKLNVVNIINEINRMKIEPRKPAIMEKTQGHDQTMLNKEATDVKPHARTGNYNPTDVTIEKFFYSGPPR
jgi:hypothetical protein